jgi:hypothetical protein
VILLRIFFVAKPRAATAIVSHVWNNLRAMVLSRCRRSARPARPPRAMFAAKLCLACGRIDLAIARMELA